MMLIPLFLFLIIIWSCDATAPTTVQESNLVCGTDSGIFSIAGGGNILTRLPANGRIWGCTDTLCEILGDGPVLGQPLLGSYVYQGDPDYFNTRAVTQYSANGSIIVSDVQVGVLDYLQYTNAVDNRIRVKTFKVYSRASLPSQMMIGKSTSGNSLVAFTAALNYTDTDGDVYMSDFLLVSDIMRLTPKRGFNGTCEPHSCRFRAVPSRLKEVLGLIQYDRIQAVAPYNKIALGVINKVYGNNIDGEICEQMVPALSEYAWAFSTLQRTDIAIGLTSFYTSAFVGELTRGRGQVSVQSGALQYTPINPYTFSITESSESCANNTFYDTITFYANVGCVDSPNVTVAVCARERPWAPIISPFNVTDIRVGVPKLFQIGAFDPNHGEVGEDDAMPTESDFFGTIFSKTQFATGSILGPSCTGPALEPLILHNSSVFCYVATQVGSYERTFFTAVDSTGLYSTVETILFENPHDMYVCSASEISGMDSDCTSVGAESNALAGPTYIRVHMNIFDYSPSSTPFRIIVDSLPSNGTLFLCSDPPICLGPPGRQVTVGDSVLGFSGDQSYFLYRGNPDYFNYVVYDTKGIGGVFYQAYTDCMNGCNGAPSCISMCGIQFANDRSTYTSDYVNSFADQKDLAFGTCYYAYDYGCPDTFTFTVQTPFDTIDDNTYNIYVSNVLSRPSVTYSGAAGGVTYTPGAPAPLALTYTDPDRDSWDVAIKFHMGDTFIGSDDILNLYVDDQAECYDSGLCGKNVMMIGLPSDIQTLFRGIYFSFFPQKGQSNSGTFSVDVWKQSRGAGTDRVPNTVPLLNSYNDSALYIVDIKTTLLLPTLTISYHVVPDYRLISYDPDPAYLYLTGGLVPRDPNINYDVLAAIVGALTVVIDVAVSFLTPMPEISITKLFASLPRIFAAAERFIKLTLGNLPKSSKAVAFITDHGGTIIKLAVRSLSIIGRGVKIIFSRTLQLAKFVRRYVHLPRGRKPKEKPQVPPLKNADDAIRLPIRDQPSLITRIRSYLTFARSGARGAKVPEKPIEIKKPPVEAPPKVTESAVDQVIARGGRLARMTKGARKAFMRAFGRVRKALKVIKKLKSKLLKKLEALGKKLKGKLSKFLKKLAKKLLRKILKKLRKSRLSRYRQKLFRRLFLFLRRKFGRLLMTAASVMVYGIQKYFALLGSIASAASFIARVIRVTIENTEEEEEEEEPEEEKEEENAATL